jgi:hypothetical protein
VGLRSFFIRSLYLLSSGRSHTDETSRFSRAPKTKTKPPPNNSQERATDRLFTFDFETSSVDRTLKSSSRPDDPSLRETSPSPPDPQDSLSTQSPIPSSSDSQDSGPTDPVTRLYVHPRNQMMMAHITHGGVIQIRDDDALAATRTSPSPSVQHSIDPTSSSFKKTLYVHMILLIGMHT